MQYCSYLGQPLVIVTIVPFLNNLGLSWCSVKMAHCGGFVRKPRKRLESTQCSCLLRRRRLVVALPRSLLLRAACTQIQMYSKTPYYLPSRHIAENNHDILIIRETGRPVQYSLWTACLRVSLIDLQICTCLINLMLIEEFLMNLAIFFCFLT